ncbi:MAG: O-antigen ligase family protein [Eubacteriales bacterium]
MSLKVKKSDLFEGLAYILIFLIGFQFLNQPHMYIFALGAAAIAYYLLAGRFIKLPLEFWVLAATFTVYFFVFRSNVSTVYHYYYGAYWLGPIVGYFVGYCLIAKSPKNGCAKVKRTVAVICAGTTCFALACTVYKFFHSDLYHSLVLRSDIYYTMQERYGLNVWSHELIHPTNLNSACIFSVLLLYFVAKYVKSKSVRIAYGASVAVAFAVLYATATRTNLVMLPIGLVLGILFSGHKISLKLTRKRLIVILIIACVLSVGVLLFSDVLENSLLANRTESLSNNRIRSIITVLKAIKDYPMGNMPYTNAHNMWVDVARVSGIIPMLLLIAYTLMILRTLLKFKRNTVLPVEMKNLFLTLTVGLLISFSFEPVIEGRPFNLMFFCMLNGMCAALARVKDQSVL